MEEEGVPSTALREVSLLQMLNESNHIVKYDFIEDELHLLLHVNICMSCCVQVAVCRACRGAQHALPISGME